MLAQRGHHIRALGCPHLQHDAQLLAEQGLERQLLTAGAHLPCPVFAVAHIHAAVSNAVALGDQHVHIQGHAHPAGKGHFRHGSQQAAIATVVVGQYLALGAQGVHGVDQPHQILGVVQIGHTIFAGASHLVQRLRQDAGGHAVPAAPQIHQHQRGVLRGIELRCQGAAHVLQRGKRAHDQGNGRYDLVVLAGIFPATGGAASATGGAAPATGGAVPDSPHGQRILPHGNGNTQGRTQLHAHRLDGGIERGVFTGLAAGGHPVGG